MKVKYFKVKSIDGIHMLNCKMYIPDCSPIGIFQTVHGMTEHLERYDNVLSFLTQKGYLCVIHDNLGHGKSVNDDSELGFIGKKDGWDLLIEDVKTVADYVRKDLKDIPYFVMGHSMGSFIVRLYAARYGDSIDGAIFMGTGGKNPAASIGILVTSLLKTVKGEKHISPLVEKMAFGSYTKKFTEPTPYSWLTNDLKTIEQYSHDKYCTFKFTVSAMKDLINLNRESNLKAWYNSLRSGLPIYIISGEMDPVGGYSKGVIQVADTLAETGHTNVTLHLYKGARHEILNDFCKEDVKNDILSWLNAIDNKALKD